MKQYMKTGGEDGTPRLFFHILGTKGLFGDLEWKRRKCWKIPVILLV